MAKLTSFAPFDFLSRLGVKDQGETILDLAESIQPVIGVGDASVLFPPILPPTAWFGSVVPAVALERAVIQVTGGRRGCYIRSMSFANQAAVIQLTWRNVAPPGLATAPLTPVAGHNMSERGAVTAVVEQGTDLVLLTDGPTTVCRINDHSPIWNDVAYVAPGSLFEIEAFQVNSTVQWSLLIQDAFGPEPLA